MDVIGIAELGWKVLSGLFGVAAFIYAYIGRKELANKAALALVEQTFEKRLTSFESTQAYNHNANQNALRELEVRMGQIDVALKHVPTNADVTNLAQSVSLVATAVAELKGEISGTTRTVDRMNQFLMERGT